MEKFIKYYKNMFLKTADNYKPHTPKQLLIYGYLFMNRTMRDEVKLSLEELVIGCGYKPSKNKGNINDKFREELCNMYVNNYSGYLNLHTTTDIANVKPRERFTIDLSTFQYDYNIFVKIPFDDFDKIVYSKYNNKDNILLVYLYIKSYIYERKKDEYGNDIELIKDKPEACALSFEQISEDTGMTKRSVINIVKSLQELQLIESYTTGGYKDKENKIHNAPNIYVLYGHQKEIPYMIDNLKAFYNVKKFFNIMSE